MELVERAYGISLFDVHARACRQALPAFDLAAARRRAPEAIGKAIVYARRDRKSTRLNSSHGYISYAVFCLKKKNDLISVPALAARRMHSVHPILPSPGAYQNGITAGIQATLFSALMPPTRANTHSPTAEVG